MKIYDCFTFYNELDLLEIRLEELYNYVDHFVIVEANTTYTSIPKPFYFEDNKSRYQKYLDKIIHIKVEDMPHDPDAWVNDRFQRDQIYRGIVNADPTDLIIVSDLDEIIRPAAIEYMRNSSNTLFALRMPLFNFKFNYMRIAPHGLYDIWGMAGQRTYFEDLKPDAFRFLRFKFFNSPYQHAEGGIEIIEHGGWQFSNLGDEEFCRTKLRSFAHTEVNTPEYLAQIDIEDSIKTRMSIDRSAQEYTYAIVELDDYFPNTILSNKDKFIEFILEDTEAKILDLLPAYPYNT